MNTYNKKFLPSTIGFDRMFDLMNQFDDAFNKPTTYPPHNIVKIDDNNYEIQIAVAGFDPEDISVETKNHQLSVAGNQKKNEVETIYLHHGLATRDFNHTFRLADTVVVRSADILNGVLKIHLENVIPEEKKPRKIPIGTSLKLESQ